METKMVIKCWENEVANFFLGWSTIDLAAYADKFGAPPKTIMVTIKGTATQLAPYGRLDITTGEVVDNTNHEKLYMLWHLFAKGEAVSSEVEMSFVEFENFARWSREYIEAQEVDASIERLKRSLKKVDTSLQYLGTHISCTESNVQKYDVTCAEKLRSFCPGLADAVCAAYAEDLRVTAEVVEKKKSIEEKQKREVVERKQRVEAFLRQQDDDLANQFRDGLLADADLRNAVRDVLFAGCKYDRYEPLSKNDCPDCTDNCYAREVSFYAEDAKNLPTDMYPAYVEFTKSMSELYKSESLTPKCTPRYHQVTCANCEGALFSRYAVLVSLEWEGMTLSREYDPFSTQQ